MNILAEALRLYKLGLAVHWIRPNSKAPVKSGWSSPTRDKWKVVKAEYEKGFGLGVRMGAASKLADGTYLANIDMDLKSQDQKDRIEALNVLEKYFPGLALDKKTPKVMTKHGIRLFVRTKKPVQSQKISSSKNECKVKLPTSEVNRRQKKAVADGLLTQKELDAGWRIRPAWEIEFMSIGKQVVLPPSIHPDTQEPYQWGDAGAPQSLEDIPLVKWNPKETQKSLQETSSEKFKAVDVDLERLGAKWRKRLVEGEDVDDRSAAAFSLAMVMLRKGYTDNEVLSALTNRDYALGEMPYEHRSTGSRKAAVAWVRDYVLIKAKENVSAARAFAEEISVTPVIKDKEKQKLQLSEVTRDKDWRARLERSGKDGMGPPKPTLQNILLILHRGVDSALFRRDTFASRESYGVTPPWKGTKGDAITDDDPIRIKTWLADHWGFEPAVNLIYEAINYIADANSFHPVRGQLEALPEWDGVPRIDTWLSENFQAKGDKTYLAEVFRKWLVASITRIYEPGAKFDWMPIFEGAQGTGKSSFGAILFGQDHFADWLPDLSDKDAALGLLGRRCIEFGELAHLRRGEIETIKAFITRQVDKVRPPYGRKTVELARQVVFFGTTNKKEYLSDDTGNRRFNPIKVGRLDFGALLRDRDQLWAEALFIYRNALEPTLYLSIDVEEIATRIRDSKRIVDESMLMIERLKDFITDNDAKKETERFDFNRFRLSALFAPMAPLQEWKYEMKNVHHAAKALRQLQFELVKVQGIAHWKKTLPTPPRQPKKIS